MLDDLGHSAIAASSGKQDIPVIIATGFAEMAEEFDKALPKLTKPFTEDELAKILDLGFLRTRESRRVLKFQSRPGPKN